ncbi:hypothetical protein GCM10011344_30360 [Dokdonia pacifica]|uniref:beta-lactamase n=1 Tax=Dokdonia pacifica TaxID=1627892 RepID=A0A239BXZ2_9FLAO|nr:serine hydrolase [Dokdonia pacifica]GGG27470.1 hypothetical protein GCM10011344_30360 [Dokdonia pacifica]SNS12522.1 D-alanyl-D-alanine carboxypeptidase [Dokdonia pacifica]
MDNPISNYIIKQPDDCALIFIKNGQSIIDINAQCHMPLASIYKLIVLKAYLEQCKSGDVNPNDLVHIHELKCYWIRWVDPGFSGWYASLKATNKVKNNQIALREIVQGMLEYSCNANTDYLLSLLHIEKVQKQLDTLKIDGHDPIMPISTSVLMFLRDIKKGMTHTPITLAKEANSAFEKLLQGKTVEGLDFNLLNDFDYKRQCDWSDALPHASVHNYIQVLNQLQALHKNTKELQSVMSWFGNLKSYKGLQGGMKLGTTPKVFNTALYATDKENNTYQLIYFLNNLDQEQKEMVTLASNDFNLRMIKEPSYVNELKNNIAHVASV